MGHGRKIASGDKHVKEQGFIDLKNRGYIVKTISKAFREGEES